MTIVRLDVWLDVACLFKTRSEAKRACEGGKVLVNGERAKPHREVREGQEMTISRPLGRKQIVRVVGIADQHMKKAEARALYEDRTPAPTPEEISFRRQERVYQAAAAAAGADPRQRRVVRRRKQEEQF